MARTDFVGDFLTVIRNAARARHEKISIPASKMTLRIAEILKEEGFVESVKGYTEGHKAFVRIHMKYLGKKSAIQGIKRVSTPGRRWYAACGEIPKVQGGLGISIVSTSRGLTTDRKAREEKIGGEVICKVW
ncbi:MAG: 30S ribosomal protein S8 [Candidatus Omnitrophota bacterium]|jgi:small subunit ribosomal protein S8